MGTLLVLRSGRIVATYPMMMKTVLSLQQVRPLIKWFYKVFHTSSKPVTAPRKIWNLTNLSNFKILLNIDGLNRTMKNSVLLV